MSCNFGIVRERDRQFSSYPYHTDLRTSFGTADINSTTLMATILHWNETSYTRYRQAVQRVRDLNKGCRGLGSLHVNTSLARALSASVCVAVARAYLLTARSFRRYHKDYHAAGGARV